MALGQSQAPVRPRQEEDCRGSRKYQSGGWHKGGCEAWMEVVGQRKLRHKHHGLSVVRNHRGCDSVEALVTALSIPNNGF